MNLLTVIGARPQFVKAAVVSREVDRRRNAGIEPAIRESIVHTGQHFDAAMSDVFFEELAIPTPAFHLGIGGLTHGAMTGRMLEAIETVILQQKPDWVLVYGDTNSTLAGALAAVKVHVPVAHVEAGLRSFNRKMPEEINRVLTDHAASLLLAPTRTAVSHLMNEGIAAADIVLSGDVMYDAALYYSEQVRSRSSIRGRLGLEPRQYVLTTIHRAENTDDPERIGTILSALRELAKRLPVVVPLHPRTRSRIDGDQRLARLANALRMIEPVGYLDMIALERDARLILTDSGGVQKEAYFFGVPCVTLRDETEWVELLEVEANRLAPPRTLDAVLRVVDEALAGASPRAADTGLYGDGHAAAKIVDALLARTRR